MYDYRGTDLNLGLQVDLNVDLPDGTPNPNVGRYYLEAPGQGGWVAVVTK
jgi:hypothetical protein